MMPDRLLPAVAAAALFMTGCAGANPLSAQQSAPTSAGAQPTYVDLVELADNTPLVLHAQVRDQAEVEPERAPGLAPGHARLFVEADTLALIAGSVPVGQSLRYLVDVPLDARGKVPKLKKQQVILFAQPVPGRPGELQLVDPGAQLPWGAELEARLRPILASLIAPDAPPVVTGIRDALAVEGNLTDESETQIFLETARGDPVSLSVVRRPGMEPRWGVSWSELVDQSARPVRPGTLEWYRLACTLPERLPPEANLAREARARSLAVSDYAFVIERLGPCTRNRG